MTATWPFDTFRVEKQAWTLIDGAAGGGSPTSGAEEEATNLLKGWWTLEAGPTKLTTPAQTRAWRALLLTADDGLTPFEVSYNEFARTAHSATVNADAAAFTDQLPVAADVPVAEGELFTLVHASGEARLYGAMLAPDAVDGVQMLTIRPALREATASTTALDFADPRCVMVLEASRAGSWPTTDEAFNAAPSVTLREYFDTPGGMVAA